MYENYHNVQNLFLFHQKNDLLQNFSNNFSMNLLFNNAATVNKTYIYIYYIVCSFIDLKKRNILITRKQLQLRRNF